MRRAQSYILRTSSSATVVRPGSIWSWMSPPTQEMIVSSLSSHVPTPRYLNILNLPVFGLNLRLRKLSAPRYVSSTPPKNQNPSAPWTSKPDSTHSRRAYRHQPPPLYPPFRRAPDKPKSSPPFSSTVSIDPDKPLSDETRFQFQQLLQTWQCFDPDITSYYGVAGPIEATVNIGPVQPPQRKGRVPQYFRN